MIFSLFWEGAFIRRGAFIRGGAFILTSEILGGRLFEAGRLFEEIRYSSPVFPCSLCEQRNFNCGVSMSPSKFGDLREKNFNIAQWSKGFFVQPAKTGTVTWEQLAAVFFLLNEL